MLVSPDNLLLVAALCLDTLVAAFALGAQGIQVPGRSSAVIAALCTGTLAVSLGVGAMVHPWLPPRAGRCLSFAVLLCLGIARLLDGLVKDLLRRQGGPAADIRFHFLSFRFLLRIYADSSEADLDRSKALGPGEAAALALALSADGLAAGFGAGTGGTLAGTLACSFLCNLGAVAAGSRLGRRASRGRLNLSWLAGTVLLALAAAKLL